MYFLHKLIKHINYVIKATLAPMNSTNDYNFDYDSVYKNIEDMCSTKFNISNKNQKLEKQELKSIYSFILNSIIDNIYTTLKKSVLEELDILNFELEEVYTLWYYYYEKNNFLKDLFLYLYKESEIYIESYKIEIYDLDKLYIRTWDTLFNKFFMKIMVKVNTNINQHRINNTSIINITTKTILDLLETFHPIKYKCLLENYYKCSCKFYDDKLSYCTNLKEFCSFITDSLIIEKSIIHMYDFKYKTNYTVEYNYDIYIYVKDISFLNNDINTKTIKFIEEALKIDDYYSIKIIFKMMTSYIYKTVLINIVKQFVCFFSEHIKKDLNKNRDKDTIFKTLIESFQKFNAIFDTNYESNEYTNLLYIEIKKYISSFIEEPEKELNIITNKLLQKKSKDVLNYTPIINVLDLEIFETLYKKQLSKRIMIGRYSLELENDFVKQMNIPVNKIKIMLADISKSEEINNSLDKEINMKIVYGAQGIWPLNTNTMPLPLEFSKYKSEIEANYKTQNKNRHLKWNTHLINAIITFKTYEIQIGGIYVDLLNKFNETDIIKKTEIDYKLYRKDKIKKMVSIKLLKDEDGYYKINDDFSYPKKKINLL